MLDWMSVRSDYLQGASYRDLAAKYGVSKNTIMHRAQKDGWQDLRMNFRTLSARQPMQQLPASPAEIESKTMIVAACDKIMILVSRQLEHIELDPRQIKPRDIKMLVEALCSIHKIIVSSSKATTKDSDGLVSALNRVADLFDPSAQEYDCDDDRESASG